MTDDFRVDLPPDALNLLHQFRGAGDAAAWGIGDLAAALSDELPYTKTAIRIAVADESGNTPSTVKDYELTARYYPQEHRSHSTLTWWHYRQARAVGDLKLSLDYLKQAQESADEYGGKPMPVRVLAAKMRTNGHTKSSTMERLLNVMQNIVKSLLQLDVPDDWRAWLEAMPKEQE